MRVKPNNGQFIRRSKSSGPSASSTSTASSAKLFQLKPTPIPEDMVILQDTREQTPLFTGRIPKGIILASTTLHCGDYSLKGFEDRFAVERKKISDLLSYCTTEREKTQKKMKQLREMEFAALIIEAKESEVYSPYQFSCISPELIRSCLTSFEVKFGVHVYINTRDHIIRWMLDRMVKYYNWKHQI